MRTPSTLFLAVPPRAGPSTPRPSRLAFVPSPAFPPRASDASRTLSSLRPATALRAARSTATKKKKKNKPAKKQGGGGGFGSAPSTPRKRAESSEGGVRYPDLEPEVVRTLVPPPADADAGAGGALSEEMYDRLEEIYGLERFNFGGEGAIYNAIGVAGAGAEVGSSEAKDDEGSSLFDDILSGGTGRSGHGALDGLLSPTSSSPPISLADVVESAPRPQSGPSATFDLNSIPPFREFRVLHTDPMVLAIDDFFSPEECDECVRLSLDAEADPDGANPRKPLLLGRSRTVGKDSRSRAQRTSTTWFHRYAGAPALMAKACRLLGLADVRRWEEPQTVRYRRGEKFSWHLDALGPEEVANEEGAGQRVATLLVYLTDLAEGDGGATMFRDLGGGDGPLKVRPSKGSALLFFPAAGGIPDAPFDVRTLHCGEAVAEGAADEKWIAQLWLRQREYEPTAPAGNKHVDAFDAIGEYCESARA